MTHAGPVVTRLNCDCDCHTNPLAAWGAGHTCCPKVGQPKFTIEPAHTPRELKKLVAQTEPKGWRGSASKVPDPRKDDL